MTKQLVLACGNTLRGDDGVAWRIAEAIERDPSLTNLQVIVSHQWTPEMAESISHACTVIFVDCSAVTLPGEISIIPLQPAIDISASLTHNVTPAALLALAQEIFGATPQQAYAVTVGGKSFAMSEKLTEAVTNAVPEAVRMLKQILRSESASV